MTIRTPDNRTLLIDGIPESSTASWGFLIWVYGERDAFRLHIGRAGSNVSLTKELGEYSRFTVREASWNGGQLLSLEDPENGGATMVWSGAHHEVYTFVAGLGAPFEPFIDRLALFDVQDAEKGLALIPRPGSRLQFRNLLAVHTLDNTYSIQVKPVADVASSLPQSTGKSVRGGSLWRIESPAAGARGRRSALLVNSSTATTLVAADADDQRFISIAESIRCTLK